MSDFFLFKNRYFITADVVMSSPSHIGKGESLEAVGTDAPVVKDLEGRPYIPGSSLKGMVRSEFESVLRGMDAQGITYNGKRLWACNLFEDRERCIPLKFKEEMEEESEKTERPDEELTNRIRGNLCTVCSIFGSTEMASRVHLKDAVLNNLGELIRVSEIRDGISIDRDTGTVRRGAKFDYEIVPAGARFGLEIVMENVDEWEVGLFLLLLKSWERGEMAIGGKTSRGLGWSKLENLQIQRVNRDKLVDYLLSGFRETVSQQNIIKSVEIGIKGGTGVAQS